MRAILPYVLMVMDETADVALVEQALGRAAVNCTLQCVQTDAQMRDALSSAPPDVVLSAFNLRRYSGLAALQLARSLCPQVPFIFVSAAIGEENAIHALRSGATDYVLKHDMARLAPAVLRALNEAALAREQKRMQEALQHSELRFRLAASTGDVWDWHVESGLAQISSQWKARLGYEDWEIENTATAWLALLEPSDRERVLQAFAAHIRHRVPYDIEYRALARDGSYRWSHAKGQAVWNENGRATYMAGSVVDITERKNAELKVKRLNRIYAVLSSINSLIVRTQDRVELFREACQIAVSAGGFRLAWIGLVNEDRTKVDVVAWAGAGEDYMEYLPFGLDSQALGYGLVGQCMQLGETLLVQDVKKDTRVALKHEAISRGFQSFGLFPLSVQHEPRGLMTLYSADRNFFDDAEIRLLEELASDIAFSLDHLEKAERLNYLAYYDALTGLPNRTLLREQLRQLISASSSADPGAAQFALVWINIDRFKNVNDTLGRHGGDLLIQAFADRLVQALGSHDNLARLGGDQFGVIVPCRSTPAEVAHWLSETVQQQMERAFLLEGKEFYISFRAGVSLFPGDANEEDALLAHAEAASREAGGAKGRYLFYTAELNTRVRRQLSMESKLHKAVHEGQFLLHYQPKVALSNGKLTGAEALIRWNDPEAGLVPPTVFIPILEETGMIIEVGRWVLERALHDHRRWRNQGLHPPRVAVNVSAVQMRQAAFTQMLKECLKNYLPKDIPLDLEITESLVMDDVDTNIRRLREIRGLGVHLAIDDFGTGYSSLAYLKRFPINYLKIDQGFVRDVTSDPDAAAICTAIIDLAHNLKLKVIAEGVETAAQMGYLQRKRCDEIQGYLFSKPLPAEEFGRMLADGRTLETPQAPSEAVRRILVVDDEPSILASTRRLLRREGYEILTAQSAREGFELLAQHEVQIILSDQRMPEMSGTEFLSRARELYPETIRIVLSGYTDLESISDAINRGAIYKFLTKPWDDDLLRDNIREAFRHYDTAQRKRA